MACITNFNDTWYQNEKMGRMGSVRDPFRLGDLRKGRGLFLESSTVEGELSSFTGNQVKNYYKKKVNCTE